MPGGYGNLWNRPVITAAMVTVVSILGGKSTWNFLSTFSYSDVGVFVFQPAFEREALRKTAEQEQDRSKGAQQSAGTADAQDVK